jgi:sugar (pentulose or hexulose) kinase
VPVLGIDIGTSGSRAVLIGELGQQTFVDQFGLRR